MEEAAQRQLSRSTPCRHDWTELAKLQLETGNTAMCVFVLAVVLVFLVLAAQYESWSLPLAVILVVPMCLLCSIAGVVVARHGRQHLHADRLRGAGRPGLQERDPDRGIRQAAARSRASRGYEATLAACKLRLRPIMMTSFAFILGVVPLVVSVGAGAEMRRTLGTAVFSRHAGRDALRHLPHARLLLRHPVVQRVACGPAGSRGKRNAARWRVGIFVMRSATPLPTAPSPVTGSSRHEVPYVPIDPLPLRGCAGLQPIVLPRGSS